LGIWRNIGKIVILLFQIVYEQIKWYVGMWSITSKSNTPDKEITELSEQEESIKRSNLLHQYEYEYKSANDQVEWSENPFVINTRIKK